MGGWIMRRRVVSGDFSDGLFPLVVLAVSFAAGVIVGFLLSAFSYESTALYAYLQEYLYAVGGENGLRVSLWSVAWDVIRWPLLAALLGMTPLGVAAIPVLLFVRGLLLSHAISVFSGLFGSSGLLVSLAAFGVMALLVVPVLFVISCDGVQMSAMRMHSKSPVSVFLRERLGGLAICAGGLVLAIALQWRVMPSIMSAVCGRLFTF